MTPDNPRHDSQVLREAWSASPLLSVQDLSIGFDLRTPGWRRRSVTREVVNAVSFDIGRQQMVALVGESGSGKSVTAMSLMGLLPQNARIDPASRILFDGRDLSDAREADWRGVRGKKISMIFQEPMSSLNPVLTVGYQISEVLRWHQRLSVAAARERSIALLEEVGIASARSRIDAYPSQLSGGQQQRVMIAMAIACEPELLIADEPTTALDVTVQKQVMELLKRLQQTYRMSILFITHDLALVGESADRVVVMRHGEVLEQGPVARIFTEPAHPYTKALLHCRPRVDERSERLSVISDYLQEEGEPPEAAANASAAGTGQGALMPLPKGRDDVAGATILEVRGLSKNFRSREGLFGHRTIPGVQDVSFSLPRGTTLGVVGESGSGKSTLGLTLLRLHQADAGEVRFGGKNILALPEGDFAPFKRRMQIIFQNPYASLNPRFTIGQILTEPMRIHGIGADERQRRALAVHWLARVGLPADAMPRYPHEFSGGQRQRIAIARCLTMHPEVLVCDESVSALDVSVQAQVLNLLRDLQQEFSLSYIFISHDLAVIRYIADQVLVMRQGQAVELAPADQLFEQPQHAYTKTLMAAISRGLG
jgi:peptide/nickel transport system ATP-binding protein